MRDARLSIARCMASTAILCVNLGWIRAFLLAEDGASSNLIVFLFLILFAFQFGVWRCFSTKKRRRWFWLGFVVSAPVAVLGLMFLTGQDNELQNWYTGAASDLAYHILPRRVDEELSNNHWDWFLAIVFFLPEFLVSVMGGLLAACLFRKGGEHDAVPVV